MRKANDSRQQLNFFFWLTYVFKYNPQEEREICWDSTHISAVITQINFPSSDILVSKKSTCNCNNSILCTDIRLKLSFSCLHPVEKRSSQTKRIVAYPWWLKSGKYFKASMSQTQIKDSGQLVLKSNQVLIAKAQSWLHT